MKHKTPLPPRKAYLTRSPLRSSRARPTPVNRSKLAKRKKRNAEYYRSSEWRLKRKAVFERDGFRCVEIVTLEISSLHHSRFARHERCPNRGEIVNGKQTARGLVCEEQSYRHRGVEGYIDTCTTRCKDCDRRLTPLERINHRYGFRA